MTMRAVRRWTTVSMRRSKRSSAAGSSKSEGSSCAIGTAAAARADTSPTYVRATVAAACSCAGWRRVSARCSSTPTPMPTPTPSRQDDDSRDMFDITWKGFTYSQ
eukprot:5207253-Prymnesium_polylepis.1